MDAKFFEALAAEHAVLMKEHKRRQAEAFIEMETKVLTVAYDKSAQYANIIILAAYAGFFGLWQMTKDLLPPLIARWSALAMLVSIVVFVAFEVFKVVLVQHNFLMQQRVLRRPDVRADVDAYRKASEDLLSTWEQVQAKFIWIWRVTLIVCILSGMTAASLVGYGYVIGLFVQRAAC
jgi:hypothetical protein